MEEARGDDDSIFGAVPRVTTRNKSPENVSFMSPLPLISECAEMTGLHGIMEEKAFFFNRFTHMFSSEHNSRVRETK